jgi:hypothetical protein
LLLSASLPLYGQQKPVPVVGLIANRRRGRRSRATTRIRSSFLVKVVKGKGVFTETLPPVGAAK